MKATSTTSAKQFIVDRLIHANITGFASEDVIIGLRNAKFSLHNDYTVYAISDYNDVSYLLEFKVKADLSLEVSEKAAGEYYEILEKYMVI